MATTATNKTRKEQLSQELKTIAPQLTSDIRVEVMQKTEVSPATFQRYISGNVAQLTTGKSILSAIREGIKKRS